MSHNRRPALNPGDPDLSSRDVPGTAFLLQAAGRVPPGADPLHYARMRQHSDEVERARRKGRKGRPLARAVLRTSDYATPEAPDGGVDFRDPGSGGEQRAIENADLLARIRGMLTIDEAGLLDLRAKGLTLAEIAPLIGLTERATYMRWSALARRVKARFESLFHGDN